MPIFSPSIQAKTDHLPDIYPVYRVGVVSCEIPIPGELWTVAIAWYRESENTHEPRPQVRVQLRANDAVIWEHPSRIDFPTLPIDGVVPAICTEAYLLPEALPSGHYTLTVKVYHSGTGSPILLAQDGVTLDGAYYIGEVQVTAIALLPDVPERPIAPKQHTPFRFVGSTVVQSTESMRVLVQCPRGVEAGDLLILSIAANKSMRACLDSLTDWTPLHTAVAHDQVHQTILWKIAGPSEPYVYHWQCNRVMEFGVILVAYRGPHKVMRHEYLADFTPDLVFPLVRGREQDIWVYIVVIAMRDRALPSRPVGVRADQRSEDVSLTTMVFDRPYAGTAHTHGLRLQYSYPWITHALVLALD